MAVIIKRDVIVAGAGPAGAICAAYLAKAGLDVLLIDKDVFPRDKVCGDMIREGFVKHIKELDAIDLLDEKSTCVRKLKLMSASGNEALVPFECYSLSRYELDKLLVDTAVSWGAEFRQDCRLEDVIIEGGKVCGVVVREKGAKYQLLCRMVIGADGVNSQLAKALDVQEEDPAGIWMGARSYFKGVKLDGKLTKGQYDAGGVFAFDDKSGPAYFWVMPVGRDGVKKGVCNVGMLLKGRDVCSADDILGRLDSWMASDEAVREMFDGAERLGDWKFGNIADNTQKREPVGEGYVLVGDVAAQIVPLFGDGLSAAADTAKAAADAVRSAFESGDFSADLIKEVYAASQAKLQPIKTQDEIKTDKLLLESLEDPHVMDKVVERLERDKNYRAKVK